jgi:hypothetical protein
MKIFVSCVSQKHGDIIANISKTNQSNLDETFNNWKTLTQGGLPSRDVYKGTQ